MLNMESKGFTVSVFNRTTEKVDQISGRPGKRQKYPGCLFSRRACLAAEKTPQSHADGQGGAARGRIHREADSASRAGRHHHRRRQFAFPGHVRRTAYVESKGLLYIGTGVSGGEEGALKGPSMMPGGSPAAWPAVKPLFQAICAKTEDGGPCCDWVGENGAGHFVKMVHNGIEYGDMQLICEAYLLMREPAGHERGRDARAYS